MLTSGTLLINRYRIAGTLGAGGFKQVYSAQDLRRDNDACAVVEIAGLPRKEQAEDAAGALFRNIEIIRAVHASHCAELYDEFTEGDHHYVVREYVQGESLQERIRRMPSDGFGADFVIGLALQILDALIVLHGLEPPFIYCNLKPSNVIIRPGGQVTLVDFGLALDFAPPSLATKIGARPYAAPEQYEHRDAPQSDLYALGAIMHHALSGKDPAKSPPFRFEPLLRLRRELNPDLCRVVDRAVEFNLNNRIQSAGEFRDALLAVKEGRPVPAFTSGSSSSEAAQPAATPPAPRRSSRQPCPYCGKRISRDARTCPYCVRDIATGEIRQSRSTRWRLAAYAGGAAILAAAAIAGAIIVFRGPSSSVPLPNRAAAPTPSPSNAEAEAEAHRVALAQKFESAMNAFRAAKRASYEREQLRRTVIADANSMNPPPGLPQDALEHIDRGEADLKSHDAANAAGEFNEALDEAPWLAQAYRGLARARELGGNPHGAIESLRHYLLASPQAQDATQVKAHIASLEQQVLASQRDAALRQEIAELQRKQQQEEAEQARIRAQQQREEEAREEQEREARRREQVAQARQHCREDFVGTWGQFNTYCCGARNPYTPDFLVGGPGGNFVRGLGAVFDIQLDDNQLLVYQTLEGQCSSDCEAITLFHTRQVVFKGTLTAWLLNPNGDCSFSARGNYYHGDIIVPADPVHFFVTANGGMLTWGNDTYKRQ